MKPFTFQFFSLKALSLIVALSFIPIVYTCFTDVSQTYTSAITIGSVLIIALATTILLAVLSMKFISRKIFIIFLFLLAFGIRFAWIYTIDTKNVSDFEIMYNAAVRAAHGDFGFTSEGEYFNRWAYQLGFTMYQAFILHFSGDSLFTLKLLNVLYSTGTTFLVYLIARRLINEACGRIAGTLYALFIPSIAMASVLTNQHLATFLFYLSFYLLIRYFHSNHYIWILIGFFLSLGDIIRPLGSLILLAIGIYVFVVHVLGTNPHKRVSAGKFVGILLVFYLTHMLISNLFIYSGVTKYPIANREPLWKFVTGLNQETTGIFSDEDAHYLAQFKLGAARNEASKELIKERIADKQELLTLFSKKFLYMWTMKDGSLIWGLRSDVHDYTHFYESLTMYERWMYISMTFFIFVSTLKITLERNVEPHHALFLLLIIGYMSIHLLIEIQTRYRYFINPSFVIFQSYGVFTFYSFFKNLFKKS